MIEFIIPLIVCVLLIHLFFLKRSMQTQNKKPTLVLLMGSGGHTTEMVKFLYNFRYQETDKIYIISTTTDKLSERLDIDPGKFIFLQTKRTNEVKQSKITAIWTTLLATINSLYLILRKTREATHLIGNGPGMCVPFYYIYFFFNKIKVTRTKLIFVQSWCRVNSISASGKLIKYVADEFLIHWEKQKNLLSNARYQGQLI